MNIKLFIIYIFGWYSTSITLSVYNKWMFSPINGLGIEYPILLTAGHQLTLWIFSFIYILIRGRDKYNKVKKVDWKFYLKFIVPTAIATAGDVVLSNISFRFVPLTVYTIVKSSSIAFVLLFSCLFKLEQFRFQLGLIVSVMFIGVVLMVYKPNTTEHNKATDQATLIVGAIIVLGSSCLSGLRWVYTQLILRKSVHTTVTTTTTTVAAAAAAKNDGQLEMETNEFDINEDLENNDNNNNRISTTVEDRSNLNGNVTIMNEGNTVKKPHPIYTVYQLAPIMFLILFVASLVIERPFPKFFYCNLFKKDLKSEGSTTFISIIYGIILILIPGICVIVLTLSEFGILQISKVLTLSIAGIIKEVLTILFGIWILSERISGIYNILGMIIVLLDVCYYNYYRYQEKKEKDKYISIPSEDVPTDNKQPKLDQEVYGKSNNSSNNKSSTSNTNADKENYIKDIRKSEDVLFFDDPDIDNIPFPTGGYMTVQEYEMDSLKK